MNYYNSIKPHVWDTMDKNKTKLTDDRAVYVLRMLEGIPEDIKDIFIPRTEEEILELELNISNFRAHEKDREKAMQLQKQYNLPLHPNQTFREVMIRIRIQQLRKRNKDKDFSAGE